MIKKGTTEIPLLFDRKMGIKRAYVGDALVYDRGGSYFYVELYGTNAIFIPKGSTALVTVDGKTFCVK